MRMLSVVIYQKTALVWLILVRVKGFYTLALRQSQKRFNKLMSKQCFRIKQCFATVTRLFGSN